MGLWLREYLGELTGAYWPRPITYWLYRTKGRRWLELSIEERLAAIPFELEFFVVTDFPSSGAIIRIWQRFLRVAASRRRRRAIT